MPDTIFSYITKKKGRINGPVSEEFSGSSSYDGSFLVFFYVCALQSYDAFFFYRKA
jgi:hypothetical protein